MKTFAIVSGVWLLLVIVGMVSYIVYTKWLPKTVTDVLSGWKTKILGIAVVVSPDIINFLTFLQLIGNDWAPSGSMSLVLRGIGTAIVVLRYITDKEQT